jgi:hypothetical protein
MIGNGEETADPHVVMREETTMVIDDAGETVVAVTATTSLLTVEVDVVMTVLIAVEAEMSVEMVGKTGTICVNSSDRRSARAHLPHHASRKSPRRI